jgi:hypothetical protein
MTSNLYRRSSGMMVLGIATSADISGIMPGQPGLMLRYYPQSMA